MAARESITKTTITATLAAARMYFEDHECRCCRRQWCFTKWKGSDASLGLHYTWSSINLLFISWFIQFIVWSIKCSKTGRNARHNFLQPNATSSNLLLCLTNSLKPKDIQFTIIERENPQIPTLEKLEQANILHVCLKRKDGSTSSRVSGNCSWLRLPVLLAESIFNTD